MTADNLSSGPHIFTLTGNLLAERTLEFDTWFPGSLQRARRETFQVGGKGINVSKMLNRLGAPNTALCFAGGATGNECEAWLQGRRFAYRLFPIAAATRAGTVIRDSSGAQRETTFLGPDVAPDAAAVQACAEFLDALPDGQTLALCGSFPSWPGVEFEPLRSVVRRWLARGWVVADSYGPPLAWLVTQRLNLVKLNAAELRSIGIGPNDPLPSTIDHWVVTDGPRPIRVRAGTDPEIALTPPEVREVSATGSGDVMLACVLHALLHRQMSLVDAVGFALPFATANATHLGIAEFPDPT